MLYVGSAIGIEILGGQQNERYGTYNLVCAFYYTIEELLEMIGTAIFIYALLLYIKEFSGFDRFRPRIDSSTSNENTKKVQLHGTERLIVLP